MDIFIDGVEALLIIPAAVVIELMVSLLILLAPVKNCSKQGAALWTRRKAIGFFAVSFLILPVIAWALFSPVFLLFLTLPMNGEVSSWGPAKYIVGVAPFTIVCLGAYFFAGGRLGLRKKALLPGAVISLIVLFGPVMCLYAKVEYLSVKHGHEFRNKKDPYYFEGEGFVFMKVFEYGGNKATTFGVYCSPPGGEGHGCGGDYYFFERGSFVDRWELVNTRTLWGGNRDDELPWPPY